MVHLEIAIGCLFTILVEVFFFFLFGYRSKKFIIAAILANLTSNLILNYIIYFLDLAANPNYGWILLAMEIGVWIYESLIYILQISLFFVSKIDVFITRKLYIPSAFVYFLA